MKNLQQSIEDRIQSMQGKTFSYGNRVHYIQSIIMDETNEKVTVKTNLETYHRLYESVPEFLSKWEPMEFANETPTNTSEALTIRMAEKDNAVADDLITLLKENIANVKKDKDFIPQAVAINNNVNSILQVVKVKILINKQYKA